ncbi:MAG: hypothetical protein QGH42_09785, partial [Kiritimatiellia bacterium]|nr:hypothetical protein [Kiritimatiellia bacterium]
AILFGLTFLNHPYIGWAFCLVAGLYMVIECLTQPDWRWCLKVVSKTALVLVAGLASVSFWLLPLYSNPESQLTEDFSGQRRHAFDVAVDTAQGVGDHYLQGSLFDQSVPGKTGVFGGKSGWAWKRNEQVKRWPVLSWGSLVGAAALLLGWRRRRNVFLVTVWVMSMLVLLGPDDVRQLTWIPFQSQVQYIHWIPVPELMVICLTAYGLYAVAALIWWVIDACLLRFISLGALQRAVLYVMLVSLCAAPFVHNVLNERFKYCFGKYRNRRFEVTEEGQTQWSLQYGNNKALQKCSDYLRNELSRFERFHGSPVIISGGTGILHLTMLPAYTERTNIISPLFGGIVGGVNRIVHKGPFRFHFWKSAIALDMMRVGAVLYPRRGKDRYPYDANVFSEQKQFGEWTVYKAAPSGPCGTTAQRPILVVGNPRMWEEACMAWFRTVQTLQKKEDVDRLPFLAWQWHPRKGKKSEMSLDQFSAICIPDPLLDADDFFHEDELSRFIDAGGTVFTVVKKGDLMPAWATYGIKRLRNLPLSSIGTDADSSAVIETVEERAGYHAVDVTAEKECFLYLKVAFHRGWRIDVDGVRVPNISLSPGFNACRLSPGKHHVAYTYTGRNRGKLGNFISLATLIGLSVTPVTGLVRRIRKRKKNGTEKERAETDQSQDGME